MDRGFDDRRKNHEDKWALDEQQRFKATARRNKLVGRWAASELGLSGDEAEAYVRSVVVADMKEPGDGDVIRKLAGDFRSHGLSHNDQDIRRKLFDLGELAREQIKSEG